MHQYGPCFNSIPNVNGTFVIKITRIEAKVESFKLSYFSPTTFPSVLFFPVFKSMNLLGPAYPSSFPNTKNYSSIWRYSLLKL